MHVVAGHRGDLGGDPLSAAALRANVPDLAEREVWVCGPDGMTAGVVAALRQSGVPADRIHHESFEL
jgi:ferredoxin-NADP reductase